VRADPAPAFDALADRPGSGGTPRWSPPGRRCAWPSSTPVHVRGQAGGVMRRVLVTGSWGDPHRAARGGRRDPDAPLHSVGLACHNPGTPRTARSGPADGPALNTQCSLQPGQCPGDQQRSAPWCHRWLRHRGDAAGPLAAVTRTSAGPPDTTGPAHRRRYAAPKPASPPPTWRAFPLQPGALQMITW
jgi:hypothetical protein